MNRTNWHAVKIADVLKETGSAKNGLANEEARARIVKYGPNILPEDKRPSVFSVFARQMRSPLVSILLAAAVITAALGEITDTAVILAAVIVNAMIGFWQEWQADRAFAALKQMIKRPARVRRDGSEIVVEASELVPGDIILLNAGDKISADGRIIQMYDLEVNEAALTGESMPVKKQSKLLPVATMLSERTNMVFQGTTVARGKAEAVVVAIGKDTAFGEIALLVRKVEDPETPIQGQLRKFSKLLGSAIMIIAAGIFVIGAIQGRPLVEMLIMAVAVAVAAIPEGLPISLTVILAIGMRNLAKRNAIVKRLLAAETLGSVSVICADKTGTLTTGEMEVVELAVLSSRGSVATVAISDCRTTLATFGIASAAIGDLAMTIGRVWEVAAAGNESINPTSSAIMAGAKKAGIDLVKINRALPKIDEIPFDSESKWAATLHRLLEDSPFAKGLSSNTNALFVRGAPEKLLDVSRLTASERKSWLAKIEKMTGQGKRLVAVAYKEIPRQIKTFKNIIKDNALPDELVFVGILALQDPLRPHIQEVVANTAAAGVRVVMITGDHAKTAAAIGAEAGLTPSNSPSERGRKSISSPFEGEARRGLVITGSEMDALDDEALAEHIKTVNIFARVLPKHKVRIVEAFHRLGLSVAMTGDGVNDAPALKAADIGVAVGSGTDVAKETADVVLLDNNLSTIVGAVEGGRNIYENVKKVVAYLLADSWHEIIVIGGALLFGLPLPVLPAQILWTNFIEDSLPNMALAFDPGEPHVMREKPRPRGARILDSEMKMLIFGAGVIASVPLFILYWYLLRRGLDLNYIRTMVFVGLGINSLFYIYSIRSLHRFVWHINPLNNKWLVGSTILGLALLVGAVYAPPLQHILRTAPIAAAHWLPLIGLGIINIALIELVKAIFIRKRIHP